MDKVSLGNGEQSSRPKVKILLVDDEPNMLSALKRQLRGRFDVTTACGGEEGLAAIAENGAFAVVVSDMRMPGMSGLEFLEKVKTKAPDTVRMMLTGNVDQETAVNAINTGNIFRFFTKPCGEEILVRGIEDGVKQHRLVVSERELIEQTLTGSIKVFIDVLSMVDPTTFNRGTKIRRWTRRVVKKLGLPSYWQVDLASMLAQIGIVAIPYEVLDKQRNGKPMSLDERDMFTRIPETGNNLLKNIPRMSEVAKIVYFQDKGFNGSGFPKVDVKGKDIPLGARLLKILHDLDAIDGKPEPSAQSFVLMDEKNDLYDPTLLQKVRETFVSDSEIEELKHEEVHQFAIAKLRPGCLLKTDIELQEGKLILAAGTELSETQIARLRNLLKIRKFKEPVMATMPRPAKEARDGKKSAS